MNDSQTSPVIASPNRSPLIGQDGLETGHWAPPRGVTPEQLKAAAKVGSDNAQRMQAYFKSSLAARND